MRETTVEKNSVRKVLNIKSIKPMYNMLVTTADVYTTEESLMPSGLLDQEKLGKIKDIQTVVSIGTGVRDINVGDKVGINIDLFAVKVHQKDSFKDGMDEYYNQVKRYNIPIIVLDNVEHLFIGSNAISFVVEDYDIIEEPLIQKLSQGKLISPSGQLLN